MGNLGQMPLPIPSLPFVEKKKDWAKPLNTNLVIT